MEVVDQQRDWPQPGGKEGDKRSLRRNKRFRYTQARTPPSTHPPHRHQPRRSRPRFLPRLWHHCCGGAQDGPPLHRHRNGRARRQPLRPAPETGHQTANRAASPKASAGRAAADFASTASARRCSTKQGQIRADIPYSVLGHPRLFQRNRAHSWRGNGASPFLGLHDGHAYALLYNGILGDKRPDGGNVLTRATLAVIRRGNGAAGRGVRRPAYGLRRALAA